MRRQRETCNPLTVEMFISGSDDAIRQCGIFRPRVEPYQENYLGFRNFHVSARLDVGISRKSEMFWKL